MRAKERESESVESQVKGGGEERWERKRSVIVCARVYAWMGRWIVAFHGAVLRAHIQTLSHTHTHS